MTTVTIRIPRHTEGEAWYTAFNASFAALRADPNAEADYEAEIAAWDKSLMDGLADWPYEDHDFVKS